MRRVESSLLIKKRIRDVWAQVSQIENWQALSETFAGWGFRFRFTIVDGPSDPPGEGTKIAVTDPKGRPAMKCRISQWSPPRRFDLTVSSKGFATGCRVLMSLRLTELDDELTNAEIDFVAMFDTRFYELVSLLLPVRFMYRGRLKKVLRQIRDMVP